MNIEHAEASDYAYLKDRDKHLLEHLISPKIEQKEIYMLRNAEGANIGWMRYGYFWDNTPFMNMLWIEEDYRNRGLGQEVVRFWENEMKRQGRTLVMTSTMANEGAQHFYRKLGYKDAGCLLLENEPLEILMTKAI